MLENTEPKKEFQWSYSRLKAYEDCPRRYYETSVRKGAWPEEESEILAYGNDVHKAMAHALKTNTTLPLRHKIHQPWIDKIARTGGELMVEDDCRWAITREMKPTPWFAKDVWLRCIADAVKLDLAPADGLPVALVVDWKAGKSANCDPVQLTLTSLMVMLQFPEIKGVHSKFIWLQEGTQTQQELYRHECAQHWAEIMPRVVRLENATLKENFPPMPGRFCRKWCPVKSCEYNGR